MTDTENIPDPTSFEHRLWLGNIGAWGNPTYLASLMGSTAPVVPWGLEMPPVTFPCPACKNSATAKAHPTMWGAMSVECDACGSAKLREACWNRAPRAFDFYGDTVIDMPAEIETALRSRLETGHYTAGYRAAMTALDSLRSGADSVAVFPVAGRTGTTIFLVARADYSEGGQKRKAFCQFHCVRNEYGAIEVRVGLPEGEKPVVGWDGLAMQPDAPVLLVEGEKARGAATIMFPGWVAICSLSGAANAHMTDWTPLVGRRISILRDNDDAGLEYARSAAAHLLAAGAASVGIAKLPDGLPEKFDVADPLPESVSVDDLRTAIESASPVTWNDVKDALVHRGETRWPPFRLSDGHLARKKSIVAAIEDALGHIDPGCHRAPWFRILGCVYHALGGDGIGPATAWSRRDNDKHGKFVEGEVDRIFEQFAIQPQATPMSVVDLFWRARRESAAIAPDGEGWMPDKEARAEAELAKFESEVRKLRIGDNIVVGEQRRERDGSYRIEQYRETTARSFYKARKAMDFSGKMRPIFETWETNQRVPALNAAFRPGQDVARDEFNLFQGLAIRPVQGAGRYTLYRELIDRISVENELPEGYLWNLLAYRMQHLDTFVPVAVVLMGPNGSFKTTLSSVMFRMLSPYSISISDPDNLAGRNNACLHDKLFVQAEEMELTSNAHNKRLLNYITNPNMDYVEKYKAQWAGENRTFIVMSSNAKVPVRITPTDRRYLVLRVSDPFDGDETKRGDLYTHMHAELEAGGYEALMYDLMHTDLSGFNLRVIPKTPLWKELAEIDVAREPIVLWWREILQDGYVRWADDSVVGWSVPIEKERLYRHYAGWCESNGHAARSSQLDNAAFGKKLRELVGGVEISRRMQNNGTRGWYFVLPDHAACCDAFERVHKIKVDRPDSLPAPLRAVL